VSFVDQTQVDAFLPPFRPVNFLDPGDPKTWGSYSEADVQMEINYSVVEAMFRAKRLIREVFAELTTITGRDHGGLIEASRCEGAEVILVALGSVSGTIKDAVDDLCASGKRVGFVKIRCYRPFPSEDIVRAVRGAKAVGVIEANISVGSEGAIGLDLKAKLCNRPDAPMIIDFVAGLGGREVNKKTVAQIVETIEKFVERGEPPVEAYWVDLNRDILT
jgi:pyruvate ferredoxin oxidoreductase alpha subunit